MAGKCFCFYFNKVDIFGMHIQEFEKYFYALWHIFFPVGGVIQHFNANLGAVWCFSPC